MKAILLEKYGTTDDLVYTDIPTPMPHDDEVLVKLLYTSINAADLDYVHGHPLVRFTGLRQPGYPILGSDLVGRIERRGAKVTHFKVGDLVWADTSNPLNYGTFAEFTTIPAQSLQKLSPTTNLAEVACLPSAGVVAMQNIQLQLPATKGHTALVNGAGGGIGNIIVQLLHTAGVEVTAVDKSTKHEMLQAIGATRTIDYETTDYVDETIQYDYVYDLVCHRPLKEAVSIVKPQGYFIMLGGSTQNILRVLTSAPLLSWRWKRHIRLGQYRANDLDVLAQLENLLHNETIKPVIDRIIPLEETINGLKALEEGHVLGKVVIKFSEEV